jgi:hypothetical protein
VERYIRLATFILVIVITGILLSACEQGIVSFPSIDAATSVPTRSLTATAEPSRPKATNTWTVTPLPTRTLTPLPTNTRYPIQTLSSDQKLNIMNVLAQTEDCQLPCWNGITVGESPSSELQPFFARFGVDFPDFESDAEIMKGGFSYAFEDFPMGTYDKTLLELLVTWSDGIVQEISFGYWDHPEQYTPEKLNSALGVPEKIITALRPGDMYSIAYSYPEEHLYIQIDGVRIKARSFDDPLPFDICLKYRRKQNIKLYLFADKNTAEWAKMLIDAEDWEDWSEALGISTEELFTRLQKENACVLSN